MSKGRLTNLAGSVKNRLLNLSREKAEDYNLVVTRYAIERFLYRLTRSEHAGRFVLKGAMLFALWTGKPHRPTRDLDLLGFGDDSAEAVAGVFRDICSIEAAPDGLVFDPGSVQVSEIREGQAYQGKRVNLTAKLGKAVIPLQADIGFGDVVTPAAEEVNYPTLLDFPSPRLKAYPKETVVAEKLQAMVMLGIPNSRMKDFYDLWTMSREFSFRGPTLAEAITATFERRRTAIPKEPPLALTAAFAEEPFEATQWRAFVSRTALNIMGKDFAGIIDDLGKFLWPPLTAAARQEKFAKAWPAGGPWG